MLLKNDELSHRVRIKICLGYKGSTLRYVLRVIIPNLGKMIQFQLGASTAKDRGNKGEESYRATPDHLGYTSSGTNIYICNIYLIGPMGPEYLPTFGLNLR